MTAKARVSDLADVATPLDAETWELVNRRFVARSITELLHERMLAARVTVDESGQAVLDLELPSACATQLHWRAHACRRALDHWHIDPQSLVREQNGERTAIDAMQFFLDVREVVGIEAFTLSRFLEETAQTLYADAVTVARGRPSAEALAHADHQTIEQSMEGHPWVIVNKGRLGFDAVAVRSFAPESGTTQRLLWLAAAASRVNFVALEGVEYATFVRAELGDVQCERFARMLSDRGLEAERYRLIPVHPWQWTHKIASMFAAELAAQRLVFLGEGSDVHQPQQSIRTFANRSAPQRCYVKTALSILNTFQIRGLSPQKLAVAPVVTTWLQRRFANDATLERYGLSILGEVATVAYQHPVYGQFDDGPYQYREMLGALWRESPARYLRDGEHVTTMAALLYVDDDGKALVQAWAERAECDLETWISAYLRAYLGPLLHCMFAHETFFVAHGENTLLVLRNGLPTRVILKDMVEEVQVSKAVHESLPPKLRALFYELDEALIPLFILTDVVDGFFRYLADVLTTACDFPEPRFWQLVRATIEDYQSQHPELHTSFERYDLFRAEFPRFCINKYRLVYHGYDDAADNVHDLSPKFDGTLVNPIATRARQPSREG